MHSLYQYSSNLSYFSMYRLFYLQTLKKVFEEQLTVIHLLPLHSSTGSLLSPHRGMDRNQMFFKNFL